MLLLNYIKYAELCTMQYAGCAILAQLTRPSTLAPKQEKQSLPTVTYVDGGTGQGAMETGPCKCSWYTHVYTPTHPPTYTHTHTHD